MKLEGKVAIITGASRGIGLEVAKEMGKQGATVIINGIDESRGEESVQELKDAGISAEFSKFDVTNESEVTESIKAIGERYGKIDILVNNAGGLGGRSRFEEMTTEFYRSVLA